MTALITIIAIGLLGATQSEVKMKKLPEGTYTSLYSKLSGKEKEQKVESFWMDAYPVTVSEFADFVKSHAKWRRSQVKPLFADSSYLRDWHSDTNPGKTLSPQSPVRYVSWFAARAYCKSKKKRLAKTAEWERAGSAFNNEDVIKSKILEWYSKPNAKNWPDVGQGPRNQFGIYDLHGLIWEWVEDFNSNLVSGESRADSSLDQSLFCGAGALNASDLKDYAAFMRYGFRNSLKGSYTTANLGFRCARSLSQKEGKQK